MKNAVLPEKSMLLEKIRHFEKIKNFAKVEAAQNLAGTAQQLSLPKLGTEFFFLCTNLKTTANINLPCLLSQQMQLTSPWTQ